VRLPLRLSGAAPPRDLAERVRVHAPAADQARHAASRPRG
jgi:hypothetical protein